MWTYNTWTLWYTCNLITLFTYFIIHLMLIFTHLSSTWDDEHIDLSCISISTGCPRINFRLRFAMSKVQIQITPLLIDIFASNFRGWSAEYWGNFPPIFMQIGQSWNSGLFRLIVLVIMISDVSYSPSDLEHGQLTSHKKFQLNILKYHVDIVKFRFFELCLCSGLKFAVKAVSIKN